MNYWSLIILILLIVDLDQTVSAQYHAKYSVVINAAANMGYDGSFISINDSLLMMVAPGKIDSSKKISTYRNGYITLKPEEVKSIRVTRKNGVAIGAAVGLTGGIAWGC